MARPARPLHIASFDVLDGRIVAVDDVIPVVVEVDPSDGVTATHTWELDPTLRGRPTARDVVVTPTSIVVASPAAGGLVRIDRASGATTIVNLSDSSPGDSPNCRMGFISSSLGQTYESAIDGLIDRQPVDWTIDLDDDNED